MGAGARLAIGHKTIYKTTFPELVQSSTIRISQEKDGKPWKKGMNTQEKPCFLPKILGNPLRLGSPEGPEGLGIGRSALANVGSCCLPGPSWSIEVEPYSRGVGVATAAELSFALEMSGRERWEVT